MVHFIVLLVWYLDMTRKGVHTVSIFCMDGAAEYLDAYRNKYLQNGQ
jgi:hypothetical protein